MCNWEPQEEPVEQNLFKPETKKLWDSIREITNMEEESRGAYMKI